MQSYKINRCPREKLKQLLRATFFIMLNNATTKLSVEAVLKAKAPRLAKFLPQFVIKWFERTICQDELNGILERHSGKRGVEFATAIIKDLNIALDIEGIENIPAQGRYIFASNHPLGALDGIALISFLGDRFNKRVKFLVNDILMNIEPLRDAFLPINKHGGQGREAVSIINDAFASDNQIVTFPAGLCSRNLHGDVIEDLQWQKDFITKSVKYQRDIIPVYFEGYNSRFFYRLGKIRRRLGLKINIEMIYLPSEIFKSRNKRYVIYFGKPIAWQKFDASKSAVDWALNVRETVYSLK